MSWKNGAYYFKGIRNGKSVFIKTDFAYGLLHNEIIAYEALKHDEGISGSIAKPLMYDKNRFQFVVFAFINGLTLDKHVREKAISHNEFESICQQFVSILNGLYRAGIVHRDLKADNFFVTEEQKVILIDFSFAVSPAKTVHLKELDVSSEKNLRILRYLGVASQVEQYQWDDVFAITNILEKIQQETELVSSEVVHEFNQLKGRLYYTLEIPPPKA